MKTIPSHKFDYIKNKVTSLELLYIEFRIVTYKAPKV